MENKQSEQDPAKDKKAAINSYAKYSALGFQMILIIGVFTYFGYKLDERNASRTPIYTAGLSLLGVFIALYLVIRSIKNQKP